LSAYTELIRGKYDNDACSKAFRRLVDSPKDPDCVESAISLSLPVAGCVIAKEFPWLSEDHYLFDDALSQVVFRLYRMFLSDGFYEDYEDRPESLFSYLYGVFRFEIVGLLKKDKQDSHPPEDQYYPQFQTSVNNSPNAIMVRVLFSEIPSYVLRLVSKRVRFQGRDREVCIFLARNLVQGRGVPTVEIKERWGTWRLPFLQSYVVVLIRMTLEEVRSELDCIPESYSLGPDFPVDGEDGTSWGAV